MQRRRAGTFAASAIAASAVVLASCNAIFGLSSGTVGAPDAPMPDADTDAPGPDDSGVPDTALVDAAPDVMPDGAGADGPPPDMALPIDAMVDALPFDAPTCLPEPATADEDTDGVSNPVDSCPHFAGTHMDDDSDGHGNACDPFNNPTPGTLLTFVGFEAGAAPCDWTLVGTWSFPGGAATPLAGLATSSIRRDAAVPDGASVSIVARFTPPVVAAQGDLFAVSAFGSTDLSCWYVRLFGPSPSDRLEVRRGTKVLNSLAIANVSSPRLELSIRSSGGYVCGVSDGEEPTVEKVSGSTAGPTGLRPGVTMPANSTATVHYIAVYEQL